jgi:hypothetical protein
MTADRTPDPHDIRGGDEVDVLRALLNSNNEQTRLRAAEALLRHKDVIRAAEAAKGTRTRIIIPDENPFAGDATA